MESMIVLKLAGARAKKRAREGRCEGRKLFGYYEGGPGTHTGAQERGLGVRRIARQFNSEGVPSRTGRPWHGFVVNRILTERTKP